ncbi:site-specific integrase [Cryobacterium sp. TMT1-3]|uniref:tyrosine-type recombinase/integrase n=1 Tax=Cryobacterium sp. TMT1-3 TaxID=1259237 RepID=UPI00106AE4F1|nr:tyrosine-type recombinase/integrase [Cryobacterium sp. TMT1-3]TFC26880.1 site-specific integrase [Cryobacterium sp. TMT1-3]
MTEIKRTRKVNRAAFGSARKLPSGRWQARYPDEAGQPMTASQTFDTKAQALDHIAEVRADRNRGSYIDHRDGAQAFEPYARAWIEAGGTRGKLAPRTGELYRDILARQLVRFDAMPLSAITGKTVRTWYTDTRVRLASGARQKGATGETRLRQSYSLLRAILGTAAADNLIAANPCRIVGAGSVASVERPYLSPDQLALIVAAMPDRFDVPLRVMLGAHLRLGELIGLQRGDFDPAHGMLRIERQVLVVDNHEAVTGTKTGTARDVALPPSVAEVLVAHLAASTGFPRSALFMGAGGQPLSRFQVQRAWTKATRDANLPGYHLHDVRHAGLTLAAHAGATTRELMARGGHRTSRAALIYQHVAEERMTLLADRLDGLLGTSNMGANGTRLARPGVEPVDTGQAILQRIAT